MTEKKRLLSNFISLAILQGTNYILPLITLPYLVRVLGPDKYGLIAFAQAFVQYFVLVTDYGFNLTATRQISIYRDNKQKVSEVLSSVLLIKVFLMIVSLLLLCIIIFTIGKFKGNWFVYLVTFGVVIGNVLFPIWFFQGMEKMKYITILNIVAKSISTICIFLFVQKSSDYIYVPLFNTLGFIVVGFISLFVILRCFQIKLCIPSYRMLKFQLFEGWHVFISTIAISLYTVSNTFILGIFTNNTVVGYYASGEKIVKAVQGLMQPISQTVYPYINNLFSKSKDKALEFIRKVFILVAVTTFLMSLILFAFSEQIVHLVLGEGYKQSIMVVKILSFLPFIIGLSNVFGIQTMLTFGYKKAFSRILIGSSILNIILALSIVPLHKHIGTSVSVLATEIIVTFSMFSFLYLKGIKVCWR